MTGLDGLTPEEDAGAAIGALRGTPERRAELAALLPETAPLYDGRTSAEVTRLRGWCLAAFADSGLPQAALPYVLEALQSGDMPYEVAGAAIAVRGFDGPGADVVPDLLRALRNMRGRDGTVSFERYDPRWPFAEPTTALTEVLRTLAGLGARAASATDELETLAAQPDFSAAVLAEMRAALAAIGAVPEGRGCHPESEGPACCGDVEAFAPGAATAPEGTLDHVALEDQDGRAESFAGFFRGKPSVVAFFYTRCENPYKCSATVTKLGAVQALVDARGLSKEIRLAAITYDPAFDLPKRLKRYGADRGLTFGDDVRCFRTTAGFDALSRRLGLGVNYGPSTVNRHRIEVYVLDPAGDVAASFTRLQWEPDEVLSAALRCGPLSSTAGA